MVLLENIMQEIVKKCFSVEIREFESDTAVLIDDVEEILNKHLSDNDGWISVNDGLPPLIEDGLSEDVLVSFVDSNNRAIAFYDSNETCWKVHNSTPYIGTVDEWHLLPEKHHTE